ncbi:unnamed protein product [Rotaria magnacalcarata]|uniref:Uncharacterized protein n=1 Tax=Rotaria magnacalcarata TaxID=392030 RepID=A0A816GUY4_9BILA|nr:unnamed protein product [Rotaria magnacalcarata]CAF4364677.1 unnamed protein product [Rotaria magnacalcarata]
MATNNNNDIAQYEQYDDFDISEEMYTQLKSHHNSQTSSNLKPREEQILSQKMSQLLTKKITNKKLSFINDIQNRINKIPHWLTKENKSFQQIIDQALKTIPIKASTNQRNDLRLIAILIYKIKVIPMYDRLWTTYFKSSTRQLIQESNRKYIYQINFKFWPKDVKTILQSTVLNGTNEDQLYRNIVHDHIHYLNDQLKQNQIEWNKKTNSFNSYTLKIEQLFEKYIDQNLSSLSLEIEHKIELAYYDYHIEALKLEYDRHNPNEYQKKIFKELCRSKYEQETTEQEFHFLKQQMTYYNSPSQSFENSNIAQSTVIDSIKNSEIRRQLFNQYKDIAIQSKALLFNFYLKTVEEQKNEYKKNYDMEVKKMWSDRHSLNNNEQISMIMIDLINERCNKISERIQCIYKYKVRCFQSKSN